MAETIQLMLICGERCLDPQSVNALVSALPKEAEDGTLRMSFRGVGAISTAFASSFLTAIEEWKASGSGRKVILCDLSVRHQKVIEMCRLALQASLTSGRRRDAATRSE